jgi:hypothetical protein
VGNAILPLFGRVPKISGELLAGRFKCEPVLRSMGAGLWPRGALKNAEEWSRGSRFPAMGFEGSVPPSEGIPTSTFFYSLEYVWGCLESVARALAMYGRIPGRP